MALFEELDAFVSTLNTEGITAERKQTLQKLIDYISERSKTAATININFICTHNSRRSHLSQAWAQALSHYFNVKNVFCYSGGTEATALFPMAAETLKSTGFEIKKLSASQILPLS